MRKRILSFAMILIMVMSLFPVSALAADYNYGTELVNQGYTFTLNGIHITEAGYYKLDGTKVDSEAEAAIQVTDPINKKITYLNGTTWRDVDPLFELEHTEWEKEAVGVYVAGMKITQSGSYNNGTIYVDIENKKITLNGATINHITSEMTLYENVTDPFYPHYRKTAVYDGIAGVPGVLVITEGNYNFLGRSSEGTANWNSYHYWPQGYDTVYKFGSIALGIMTDDESGATYENWTLELIGENTITVNNTFSTPMRLPASGHEYYLDSPAYGIFAEANLTITGTGSLNTNVDNQWDFGNSGYLNYGNPSTAGAIWSKGDLEIAGGTITAETVTTEIENGYTMTGVNTAAAIGAAGSVTITGESTSVAATDTTSQGSAIRGTTGVTITNGATVNAASSSDIAGAAIMAGASQWSGATLEISDGANVTATAASTSDNEMLTSGVGIVGGSVSISESTVNVETQVTGIAAGVLNVESGDVEVSVSNENGTAIEADSGSIAVGSYNTPVDSDLIADGSVVADGEVMPKEELTEYTARIENTYYTGEDGGNKAIADLSNKQTVWLNTNTSASRNDFALGNTITIMLAEGVEYTGTISGPNVKADVQEGIQEELDKVLYTEYIYTLVVDSDNAAAKVIHADGTETFYNEVFGSNGPIYVTNKLADGDTIVILQDAICTYYGGYDIEKDVTLDLNGKTLSFADTGGLNVEGKADDLVIVTIIDSSSEKTGKIVNTYTTSSNYVGATVVVRPYAEVTIEGGTYDGKTTSSGGKLTLAGGTYLREVVAGTYSNTIGTVIVTENADISGCTAYADGGILILPNQNIGGDVSASDSDNVKWKLVDEEGNNADIADVEAGNCKLVIYGKGEMKSFSREDAPWIGYNGIISEIIIEDGVTNISDSAFEDMNGYDLTLGNSITSINTWAFDYCKNLGVITIPKDMTVSLNNTLNNSSRTVEGFVVAEGNSVYSTDGTALYYSGEIEGNKLMKVVAKIDGNYEIDDTIVDIKARAFDNVLFDSVVIPSSFDNVYTFRKPAAVPDGMVFGGYYTFKDTTVVEELKIDTTGDDNKEAFTVYMVLGYEVTYDFGSGEETVVVPTDKTISEFAPNVSIDGKELKGWSTTANGTEDDASALKPTTAMTVYAIYETDAGFTPDYTGITKDAIVSIDDQTYTGEEIKPAVFYKDASGQKKQIAESELEYTNNINAGQASVSIKGTNVTVNFTITPAEFNPSNHPWTDGTTVYGPYTSSISKTYDGQIHSLTVADLPAGINVTYTYDNEQINGVSDVKRNSSGNATSYSIKATFDLGENYVFDPSLRYDYQKTKSASLTINPLELTITADNKTMYVGEEKPVFTYTVEGLKDGMNLTTEPAMTTSASGTKVGNFPITASGAVVNNDSNNYKITYVEGYLTVGMKIMDASITYANDTVIYDGEEHNLEITVDGTLPDSFTVEYFIDGEPFTGVTDAGTYEVTAIISCSDPAYDQVPSMTATLTITPAALTITADDVTIYAGDDLPELTYSVDGLVAGDSLISEPTLSCDADTNVYGTYEIVIEDAVATDNYTIDYVNGELTVEKKPSSGFDYDAWYWALMMLYNQQFDVSASTTEGGTITPDGISKVKYDKNITYTITPDEGYAIADVLVNGESVDAVSEYTIKRIKKDQTIHAIFVKTAWENPYTDVSDEAWYYEDVEFVSENGLMIGTGDNKFSPSAIVNRAMLVTVLWRLEGSPVVDSPVDFYDVPADEWYTAAVNWAAANGIVNGYGDGIFGAMNDLTHEQIMAILNRYAVYKKWSENVSGNADDSYTNSEWAENNVLWADLYGMFDGIGSDISDLTEGANRAELAAYLRRFCERFMAE